MYYCLARRDPAEGDLSDAKVRAAVWRQQQGRRRERKVAWRVAPVDAPFGWIDTGAMIRPTPSVCVYATTFVRDAAIEPGRTRTISIFAGSAGAMRITFDGTVALEDVKYRSFDAERLWSITNRAKLIVTMPHATIAMILMGRSSTRVE